MRTVEKIIINFKDDTKTKELMAGRMRKDDVRFLSLQNLQYNIGSLSEDSVEEFYMCDQIEIILNSKSDKTFNETESLFERLTNYQNISSIKIYFDDRANIEIYVPWDNDDDCVNKFQDTYIDSKGNLHIEIGESEEEYES